MYELPDQLINILNSEKRNLMIKSINNPDIGFIKFHSLFGVREFIFRKKKFLDLISYVDEYNLSVIGFLCWYPKRRILVSIDCLADPPRIIELCSIEEFLQKPSLQIDKIFE